MASLFINISKCQRLRIGPGSHSTTYTVLLMVLLLIQLSV